jgi:hypothetical protein
VERPVGRMMNGRGNYERDLKGAGCMNLVAAVERVSMKLALQRGFILLVIDYAYLYYYYCCLLLKYICL